MGGEGGRAARDLSTKLLSMIYRDFRLYNSAASRGIFEIYGRGFLSLSLSAVPLPFEYTSNRVKEVEERVSKNFRSDVLIYIRVRALASV